MKSFIRKVSCVCVVVGRFFLSTKFIVVWKGKRWSFASFVKISKALNKMTLSLATLYLLLAITGDISENTLYIFHLNAFVHSDYRCDTGNSLAIFSWISAFSYIFVGKKLESWIAAIHQNVVNGVRRKEAGWNGCAHNVKSWNVDLNAMNQSI